MNARSIASSVAAAAFLAACAGSAKTGGGASAPVPAAKASNPVAAAAPAAPKAFEYTPGTSQYRYISSAKLTQSFMGQSRDDATSANRLMTITLARVASDTLSLAVTIDSMSGVGQMGNPIMGIDKIIGTKWGAKISPAGVVYSTSGPSETENPIAAAMTDEIARTLPRIKGVIAPGAIWTDSIKDKVKQAGGIELDREVAAKYAVAGDTTVNGEPSWKVNRDYTVKATGKGNSPQAGEININLSGSGKGILVISKKGVLLGGAGEESNIAQILVVMQGAQLGMNTTTTTSFTKIK